MSITDHPAVQAARQCYHDAMRRCFEKPDAVRHRMRVEITHDIRDQLRALADREQLTYDHKQFGPMQVEGISYYVVDHLPEPGWRVIF